MSMQKIQKNSNQLKMERDLSKLPKADRRKYQQRQRNAIKLQAEELSEAPIAMQIDQNCNPNAPIVETLTSNGTVRNFTKNAYRNMHANLNKARKQLVLVKQRLTVAEHKVEKLEESKSLSMFCNLINTQN